MPPYSYRFLSPEQRTEIVERITSSATDTSEVVAVDDGLQAAWELDLAAHRALLTVAEGETDKARHRGAIRALEAALTEAAAGSA